ncbi:MAG: type II toxin-antitoxin system VapC family toxin [Rhodospirillaceae bacterium]
MSKAVLDSSAVLAVLLEEAGAERVERVLPGALVSAVNLAEVVSKLCERGMPADEVLLAVAALGVDIVPYEGEQARLTGELRPRTRAAGLSLGDRACLALARLRGLPALTADAAWVGACDGEVVLIRGGH